MSPAFQFYPGDYLRSQRVQLMSLEEEGGYVRLLATCWLHGSIPADPEMIARLIGKGASTTLATTLATMFQPHLTDGSRLVHERLEEERAKQDKWRTKSMEGGLKSGQARQRKHGSRSKPTSERTTLEPPFEPNGNHPTNQKATLQSSVYSINTPIVPLKGTKGPLQLRAEALMRRKPETPLTHSEERAFRKNKAAITSTSEDDWRSLEQFYACPQSETFARKDLATLLNNWNGEIDRAKGWLTDRPSGSSYTLLK